MKNTREKLSALRRLMKRHSLAAYLVPSTDPHGSEYVPACWQRRAWLSGFNGSAGDVVVMADRAGLWTDGRYFLQAEAQLKGSGITLFKMGEPGVPTIETFLEKNLKRGWKLGVDPRTVSSSGWIAFEKAVKSAGGQIVGLRQNLVDEIWPDRPDLPLGKIQVVPERVSGETTASKLRRIRVEMKDRGADAHVLSTLDAAAWTFNIRCADVDYNPVAISYAIVTAGRAQLFVRPEKLTPRVRKELGRLVELLPYEAAGKALLDLGKKKVKVWVDGGTASRWVVDCLRGCKLITDRTPVAAMKAKKNATEIKGMKRAHVRDGLPMVRFLYWLERQMRAGNKVTELSAEAVLEGFRREGARNKGLSFQTISAYGPHGAIIHYSSEKETDVRLAPKGIYLIDSGGQYLDGTTDITRTVLLGGRPTRDQVEQFTRVLQGHIRLALAKFPAGVRGMRLDTIARVPLWEIGLDYNHGTGHGVGAYLSVHEGPMTISPTRCVGVPLEEGNILSNEPGYYKAGAYGIRLENLVLVAKDPKLSTKEKTWYRFDTITVCPIDRRLLLPRLLSKVEKDWLNAYHRRVERALSPHLKARERRWLGRACRAI